MEKIKQFIASDRGKDILTVIIVILVGFGSFGLGRLSKESQNKGLNIQYTGSSESQGANTISGVNNVRELIYNPSTSQNSKNMFFASSRGTKYYPRGCSAGQNIKQENRVYFSSSAEAEKAGYALSSSCR